MRTEPTTVQRLVAGILGLGVAGALGLWLSMSYFGVWTSDAKVSVSVPEIGDSIGPGAKVRYHGIIVGRVLKLSQEGDEYLLKMVVNHEHARSIPSDATVRILPSTIFGAEYVELLADHDAQGDDHLASGDVLESDSTDATLRLMSSFDQAERLISAIDAEDINRITGKLAPALDGNGQKIKDFLVRADETLTAVNQDLPTTWETLRLAPGALDTLTALTPDLMSAAQHSQKTLDTIAERDRQLGSLLGSSTRVIDQGNTLIDRNREVLVPFVARLERLTGLVADNSTSLRSVLTRFSATTNNGSNGVDDNAIQMIGTIGTDLLKEYTAADCTRYGPHLVASNCGDPVPADETDPAVSGAQLAQMLAERGVPPMPLAADSGSTPSTPAPTTGSSGLTDLFDLLTRGLSGSTTGGAR